jgi:hypothetical protein
MAKDSDHEIVRALWYSSEGHGNIEIEFCVVMGFQV